MRVKHLIRPWALLVGVAIIYRFCVIYFWAYTPRYNPITDWILDAYAESSERLYYMFTYTPDLAINILLALPFAYLISKIQPDRRWVYAASVVFAILVWEYRLVFFVHRDPLTFFGYHQALIGLVIMLFALPTALLILTAAGRRRSAA